jgi:Tfp pilus assembly protein PilX
VKGWTFRGQRGATLFVGLIMLVLITLMVITALRLANSNLRAVGNMQFRDEAIAAANRAVNTVLESNFTASPVAEVIAVDIDEDARPDYQVSIAQPVCVRASQASEELRSSLSLPARLSSESTWSTVWEVDASVSAADTNLSGAAVRVRSGVRVLVDQATKDAHCN